uniref:NADH-ubiquinone oxidoreductase chain 3 n=1 Tax=Complanledra complana TaxID=3078487 RepID=A0AAU6PBW2_9HEMI
MYLVFFFMLLIFILLIFMGIFSFFLNKKTIFEFQSSSPFECGFNSISLSRLPFSIHFFLIAVIFLIFDVEILVIFPIVIILVNSSIYSWFFVSSFFLFILLFGLYHEWYNGIINWTF